MMMPTLLPIEAPEELAQLVLPAWGFPLIVAIIFAVLAIISWSYRDVAHRHANKTDAAAAAHQDAHH